MDAFSCKATMRLAKVICKMGDSWLGMDSTTSLSDRSPSSVPFNSLSSFSRLFNSSNNPLNLNLNLILESNGFINVTKIALDSFNNSYITGLTNSSSFPTKNAYDSSFGGGFTTVYVHVSSAWGT